MASGFAPLADPEAGESTRSASGRVRSEDTPGQLELRPASALGAGRARPHVHPQRPALAVRMNGCHRPSPRASAGTRTSPRGPAPGATQTQSDPRVARGCRRSRSERPRVECARPLPGRASVVSKRTSNSPLPGHGCPVGSQRSVSEASAIWNSWPGGAWLASDGERLGPLVHLTSVTSAWVRRSRRRSPPKAAKAMRSRWLRGSSPRRSEAPPASPPVPRRQGSRRSCQSNSCEAVRPVGVGEGGG